jgi:alpha-L-fucosidase
VEVDTPLRRQHWFWHPHDEASLKTVDELLDSYENAVGHGGQWMIGVAPDNRGLVPDADVDRLRELGKELHRRYDNNLVKTHLPVDENTSKALDGDIDTFWSAPSGSNTATLEVRFTKEVTFDHAMTMEWLTEGQRVQKYNIEVWQNNRWEPVMSSFAIGHKKIDHFTPV